MKILLVEDDLATRKLLEDVLIDRHYDVETTGDGRSALDLATEIEYDLILLDINIPELDGISLCKRLRAEDCQIPILLLTAKDEISDRIVGLDAGADDYAIKPFSVPELLARIRALLRRGSTTFGKKIVKWEHLQLNCITNQICYGDRLLYFTPKEYGIVELLLLNPQRIFSRAALIDRLWDLETAPTESVINSHIKSIRQKLKKAGAIDPIETLYGFGYRLRRANLVMSVEREDSTDALILDGVMLDLFDRFKPSLIHQIDLLVDIAKKLRASPSLSQIQQSDAIAELGTAREIAHQLAGSLGVYGFPQGSMLARQIEDLLNPTMTLTATELQRVSKLITQLREEIDREPQFTPDSSVPPTIAAQIELRDHTSLALWQNSKVELQNDNLAPTGAIGLLIIDREPTIWQKLAVILPPWRWEIYHHIDPQQFWAQLTNNTPDLVIVEIDMPEVSGIELCQAIKNDPQWGHLPVLLMSATPDHQTILQAFAAGADDYLHKPIRESEAIARIVNQIHRHESQPQR